MIRLIAALVLLALSVAPVQARGPEQLTPQVQQHLASLNPLSLRDPIPFEGRPVLVKFFASW